MDRWLEIDLDWFGEPPCRERIGEFADRVAPLLEAVSGERGVILNVGWLADIVTEWRGDGTQLLPLRSRRYSHWTGASYADLGAFVSGLRSALVQRGVAEAKVGLFLTAPGHVVMPPDTGELYDLYSDWSERHPELYPLDLSRLPGPDLDLRVPLRADDYPYASQPDGLAEGTSFATILAAQWGHLARFAGFDALHLRDAFWGPMLYSRKGQYGTAAHPDPDENASWTDAVADLFVKVKAAYPEATVMAYSSAVSQTAEWRVGCVDMEKVIAAGGVDVFVDQSWGGAWQDWWDDHWKGWTFQLANILGHGVPLRRANAVRARRGLPPCRHSVLIETWDGWEPWDTLHRTPGKLEWAMWAFTHASVVVDGERFTPESVYISWMNDREGSLLSPGDIEFLRAGLGAAEASAQRMTGTLGPIMVVDHDSVAQVHDSDPTTNASDWIEDQLAMAMKAGLPVLEAGDPGAIALNRDEGYIHQLPRTPRAHWDELAGPFVASGRFDLLDRAILKKADVAVTGELHPAGYRRDRPTDTRLPVGDSVHLPTHAAAEARGEVRYSASGIPLLAGRGKVWVWQAPDLESPGDPQFPRSQLGTTNPYHELARVMAEQSAGLTVEPPESGKPVTVHAWREGATIVVLAGNLETGWVGDCRSERRVRMRIPQHLLGFDPARLQLSVQPTLSGAGSAVHRVLPDPAGPDQLEIDITVPPAGLTLVRLSLKEPSTA